MVTSNPLQGLSRSSVVKKRLFDFLFALIGIITLWWLVVIAVLLAWADTGQFGLFVQERIGQFGKPFKVYKIRTMKSSSTLNTTVTTANDMRITSLGRFFRNTKLDELPQLYNVLTGKMSFVGPRPDVPGFADLLQNDEKIILSIKPGITGPATLAYRNEEEILTSVEEPERYNAEVIFPDKVRINIEYIKNYTLLGDVKYIVATIFG